LTRSHGAFNMPAGMEQTTSDAPAGRPAPAGPAERGHQGRTPAARPTSVPVNPWVTEFGRLWRLELALVLLACATVVALRPLSDADLPMHLATGEWIVRHRAVPTRELFAWTNAGAPFYALAWGPQVLFYGALALGGQVGLRVVAGALVASAAFSVYVLGRVARWSPGVTLTLAALNVVVVSVVADGLRPQVLLFSYVPLAWAAAIGLTNSPRTGRPAVALFAVSAMAVNSHLFFPLVLAPLPILWATGQLGVRRAIGGAACVAVGWAATPYVALWTAMLRYQLHPYALFQPPSPITELGSGFGTGLASVGRLPLLGIVILLLAFPWAAARTPLNARAQVAMGIYWAVGLMGFGRAIRLAAVWWLIVFPMFGLVAAFLVARSANPGRPVAPAFRWLLHASLAAVVGVLALEARQDLRADVSLRSRHVPSAGATAVWPVADWIEDHVADGAAGRIFTTFNYGSYLTWRLPTFSSSLDSRGSLPDSVVAPFLLRPGYAPDVTLGPWRGADLAIVPVTSRFATTLDTAAGWTRVGISGASDPLPDTVGLWVRERWWLGVAGGPVPRTVDFDRTPAAAAVRPR
jgi:hypothetical protein